MSSPSTTTTLKEYKVLPVTIKDKTEILNFLKEFFFKDEPLNKHIGLVSAEGQISQDLEDFSFQGINNENGLNLKAVYRGNIIGVCLNDIVKKGYQEENDHCNITDTKVSKISSLLEHVEKEANVFARFSDCDKAMAITVISVNEAYRRQGIAKKLVKKTSNFSSSLPARRDRECNLNKGHKTKHLFHTQLFWTYVNKTYVNTPLVELQKCMRPASVDFPYSTAPCRCAFLNSTKGMWTYIFLTEMARELGCGFMFVDCTSQFSAQLLKRIGFELLYSLKYTDYKANGEVVFKPEPPHDAVSLYVQKI